MGSSSRIGVAGSFLVMGLIGCTNPQPSPKRTHSVTRERRPVRPTDQAAAQQEAERARQHAAEQAAIREWNKQAMQKLATYAVGTTTYDQVMKDFGARPDPFGRGGWIVDFGGPHGKIGIIQAKTVRRSASLDKLLSGGGTGAGQVVIGFWKGGPPTSFAKTPDRFVVLDVLRFVDGVLASKRE